MQNIEAFTFFINKILSGEEGVFWSEKNNDQENFVLGFGEKTNTNFDDKNQFPLFTTTNFLGTKNHTLHFKNNYSAANPPEIKDETFPHLLQNINTLKLSDLKKLLNESEQSFCSKINKTKSLAEDGELWVLNLAHQISGKLPHPEILLAGFYKFLQSKKNHSGGIWWTIELKFCSMSPEIFIQQNKKQIKTFPIKGTNKKSDQLQESEKEIAELFMITDLIRNDLSQICNNVHVEKERVITNQKDFFHAHSEISGILKNKKLTWNDYLKLLPAGSISGAPKKRVVEKILDMENFDRKFYTGTFGVKTSPNHFTSNILIRTIFAEDNKWTFPVGAGITIESNPQKEWQETFQKAGDLVKFFG